MPADLWVPYLDNSIGMMEGVLEQSLSDYKLCKKIFSQIGASRCLGSALDRYCRITDADAAHAFLFTKMGPQRLIRPLEESRAPRRAEDSNGPRDLDDDPITGEPNWVWIINKPFEELG
jgi:hypothetical protein